MAKDWTEKYIADQIEAQVAVFRSGLDATFGELI